MRRLDRQNSDDLFEQMQNMIEEFQNKGMNLATEFTGHMPIDVREEDGNLIISADLPGVQKEDINIKADGQKVEISAEASQEIKEENEKYLRKERSSRSFRRTVQWPREVDEETINAEYEDGVLEISAELSEDEGTEIEIE
ncbi:Hsp20/alpha crystallin family protein [Candidatus Nanohalobium constans]|uniref:Molecular chaperone IbpA, HSP20 family n=1 Tax=Candidatus Nanohalobium constans TaxID=2565781 RepID=A0A5Q0UEN3_9ARCH|nr:Hsp20/alpha crystallin family protein [Candidatus Nanohalobium constans]QGA79998.1 molecular chaperone IbpA, HSP20 family [Candidatus Nanohalobium constans]